MNYFIIDTHGEKKMNNFREADFEYYIWDQSIYNQVEEGDRFIYRRPTKSSENGKFYFFGAAQFSEIHSIDSSETRGRVRSRIINGESFDEPIYQDDERLRTYFWEFKKGLTYEKNGNNWMHFFNQYGMTKITEEDYHFLLRALAENSFVPEAEWINATLTEPEVAPSVGIPERTGTGNRVRRNDFEKQAKESKKTGNICEELVYKKELEIVSNDKVLEKKIKDVIHVSNVEGDGHGYDIVSYRNIAGEAIKIYIEVKGTKGDLDTPFFMSENERRTAEENPEQYYIYRVSIKHIGKPKHFVLAPPVINQLNLVPKDYIVGIDSKYRL